MTLRNLIQKISLVHLSIRGKTLLLLISTILVTVALLAGISVWRVRKIVTEESLNAIRQVLDQVNNTIDSNTRQAEQSIAALSQYGIYGLEND